MHKPLKIRTYLRYLVMRGGDPEAVLAGSGISYAQIRSLEPVAEDTMATLFDLLATRTPGDFAVDCGMATQAQDFGMVGYTIANSPTIRDAIVSWVKYAPVAGHPLVGRLHESGDQWEYQLRPRYPLSPAALRFCMEASLCGIIPVLDQLSGRTLRLLRYGFPFSRGNPDSRYLRLAPVPLAFNLDCGKIIGMREDLDLAIEIGDPEVQLACEAHCAHALSSLAGNATVTQRVIELLVVATGGPPSLEQAANLLGMSCRSLSRSLAAEQQSYRKLLSDFRRDYAFRLLGDGRIDIKRAAHLLGFQDPGSFRRAFRGWTGTTIAASTASHREPTA